MAHEQLGDLIANVEVSLVNTVDRLERAELERLYVEVLELEERMHALHEVFAFVAESLAAGED